MTSPPPHKDLIEAAKLIAFKRACRMGHVLDRAHVYAGDHWHIYLDEASAVARFLLSRELSPGAIHDGEGYMDMVHCAEYLNTVAGRQAEFACGYQAANIRRLKELGLDAKEGG